VTGGEAEDFVRGGVVVVEGIDAVAPLRRPAVAVEEGFAGRGGVAAGGEGAAIKKHGKAWIVGHPAVGFEMEDLWLRHGGR
jgi:hypothetical protein